MPYVVDFENVSTVGLESSPVAKALAGLRANEARYYKNKYDHVFTVTPASDAPETLDWVNLILARERDLVIAARPLEVSFFEVDGFRMAYVCYESGLSINVMYGITDGEKRAVGFKLSEGMEVPEELASRFKFARQKSKLAGVIRGSFFVIKANTEPDSADLEYPWALPLRGSSARGYCSRMSGPRAVAIVQRGHQVLVIKRHRLGRDYSVLPGGSVEPGESYEDAVVRELREESTLRARVASQVLASEHNGREARYFLMTDVTGTPQLSGPELEAHCPENSFEFVWASMDDLEPLGLQPEHLRADLPRLLGLLPCRAPRCGRGSFACAGVEVVTVQAGDSEGQVERLAAVEAGIAGRLVAVDQVALGDVVAAAGALGDVVAGEFDVDAAGMSAECAVHLEESGDFVEHVVEVPGLVAAGRFHRVAVHRVAYPGHRGPAGGHLLDQRGQRLADPPRAHPGGQGEPARLLVRVEGFDQLEHVLRGGVRADLDGDGIADLAGELDMGAAGIAGALADPQQVSRQVVGMRLPRVGPGQGPLKIQQQRLMAGVELHRTELPGVSPARVHERDRPVDLVRQLLIALPGRTAGHEVLVPGVHLAQVGVAAAGQGPAQVQGGRRAVIRLKQAARVRRPRRGRGLDAVDRIAPVDRTFHAVPHLSGR